MIAPKHVESLIELVCTNERAKTGFQRIFGPTSMNNSEQTT